MTRWTFEGHTLECYHAHRCESGQHLLDTLWCLKIVILFLLNFLAIWILFFRIDVAHQINMIWLFLDLPSFSFIMSFLGGILQYFLLAALPMYSHMGFCHNRKYGAYCLFLLGPWSSVLKMLQRPCCFCMCQMSNFLLYYYLHTLFGTELTKLKFYLIKFILLCLVFHTVLLFLYWASGENFFYALYTEGQVLILLVSWKKDTISKISYCGHYIQFII